MTLRFRSLSLFVRFTLALSLALIGSAGPFTRSLRAQDLGDIPAPAPSDLAAMASNIEINSLQTSYDQVTGVASAEGDVVVKYEDVELYADRAEYHRTSGDIFARDNVTIYKSGLVYKGDAAVYNIQTGKITANQIRSAVGPLFYDSGEINLNTEDLEVITRAA